MSSVLQAARSGTVVVDANLARDMSEVDGLVVAVEVGETDDGEE